MLIRPFQMFLGACLVLAGIAACANQPAPTPTPVPPTVAPAGQTQSLPPALQDVTATQIYRFRVDPAQTSVEYAVHEVLLGNNQVTRGRTNAVQGEFQLYMQNKQVFVALSSLQVDLTTLTSDNAVRDQAIRKTWLESEKYPRAIFVASSVQGLPPNAVLGQPYKFQVVGDLTVRNITHPVTFDVTATVNAQSIVGEGTTTIYMKDYGFDPPSIVGKTIVSDPVVITIKGTADLNDD